MPSQTAQDRSDTGTSVSVVIATRDRPQMLREAIESITSQEFGGRLEIVVVYDQADPDYSLNSESENRRVRVISNARSAGLAGARNTGIEASTGEFIAFCDDDDFWHPGKLQAQLDVLQSDPTRALVTCGITVRYDGKDHDRVLQVSEITFDDLLRDRHTELHPSTFLIRRSALVDGFGLVDENVPGGYGEDYEFLLRAARYRTIAHLPPSMVVVRWGAQSFFFRRWQTIADGLVWLLQKYPEFEGSPAGAARIRGQVAFANATLRNRRMAVVWALSALRRNPLEARGGLAIAVAAGLLSPDRVLTFLHKRGRGI